MLQSSDDVPRALAEGRSILGPGWKAINSFDDLSDPEDFEESEEVRELLWTQLRSLGGLRDHGPRQRGGLAHALG